MYQNISFIKEQFKNLESKTSETLNQALNNLQNYENLIESNKKEIHDLNIIIENLKSKLFISADDYSALSKDDILFFIKKFNEYTNPLHSEIDTLVFYWELLLKSEQILFLDSQIKIFFNTRLEHIKYNELNIFFDFYINYLKTLVKTQDKRSNSLEIFINELINIDCIELIYPFIKINIKTIKEYLKLFDCKQKLIIETCFDTYKYSFMCNSVEELYDLEDILLCNLSLIDNVRSMEFLLINACSMNDDILFELNPNIFNNILKKELSEITIYKLFKKAFNFPSYININEILIDELKLTCKVIEPKLINYIVDEFKYILNSLKSTSEQLQKSNTSSNDSNKNSSHTYNENLIKNNESINNNIKEYNLNDQSELSKLGYSSRLSRSQRWRILTDNAIPKIGLARTRNYLEWFIRIKSADTNRDYSHAISEWIYDLNQINKYYK